MHRGGVQAWTHHRQCAEHALSTIAGTLDRMRQAPQPVKSLILKAAADSCSATATKAYLRGFLRPCPEAPRELSDAVLQLTSHAKRARTACSELSKQRCRWHRCDSSARALEAASTSTGAVGSAGASDAAHASSAQQTGCPEPMHAEVSRTAIGLEAALVLESCVRSIEQETALLEAIVQQVDLRTSADRLAACREVLGVRPYLCEEVLSMSADAAAALHGLQPAA